MEDGELTQTFAALADPTRRALLAHLAREDATVNVLAGPFPMSLQAISRHLKVLEGAGLITRGRDAQFRPRSFREAPLEDAADWIAHVRETGRHGMDQRDENPYGRPKAAPSESAFTPPRDWAR